MAALQQAQVVSVGSYDVVVGSGILAHIVDDVVKKAPSDTYVAVTDDNLAQLHLPHIQSAFAQASSTVKNTLKVGGRGVG